jgi:hypothetical protein
MRSIGETHDDTTMTRRRHENDRNDRNDNNDSNDDNDNNVSSNERKPKRLSHHTVKPVEFPIPRSVSFTSRAIRSIHPISPL